LQFQLVSQCLALLGEDARGAYTIDRGNVLAVYWAYSDEAGVGDPRGEFLVAGYIAEESEWPHIINAWRGRVLDGPPVIPYLHVTEIRSTAWREKQSVSWLDAERRIDEAMRVLYSSGALFAVTSVMRRADLQELFHKRYAKRKHIPTHVAEPDYLCYLSYVAVVLNRAYNFYPDAEIVNFVVSEKQDVTQGLRQVFDATRLYLNEFEPAIAPLLGQMIPASMEKELPLQMADALCWHLQRYHSGKFNRTEESRMWMLLKERNGQEDKWSREGLEESARSWFERQSQIDAATVSPPGSRRRSQSG
jgi:hypothetical protein